MRLYVANVGVNAADARKRRLRSPVFPDGSFEFVPIKEHSRFSGAAEIPAYRDLRSWSEPNRSLARFLPEQVRSYRAHADPEFETFTYGDIVEGPAKSRAANLKHATRGDQLWFLARLWNHDRERWRHGSALHFVGFLEVESNHRFDAGTTPDYLPPVFRERIRNNAHYRRMLAGERSAFRILCGNRMASQRFERAVEITPEVAGLLFCGTYDSTNKIFRRGEEIVRNKNGRPRRFDRFASITRTIQCFLDSRSPDQRQCIEELTRLARAPGSV